VSVSADGRRVIFLRSQGGDDPVTCLWVADAETGEERLVADPRVLLHDEAEVADLPPEERVRRERMREAAGGITAFATDRAGTVTAFAAGGRLFVAGLLSGAARPLPVAGPVVDPRPDPPARRVAYVSGRLLCVAELDGTWRVLAGGDLDEPDSVTWGSADFIAAEEMHRYRGYWWSPDGAAVAVCRVDDSAVQRWWISDPGEPAREPVSVAYPMAGTANADVSLHIFPLDGSEPVDVEWDREALPYLAAVDWTESGLILTVQSRDQRVLEVRSVETATGSTDLLFRDRDDVWVELVPGSPRLLPDGRLAVCADRDGVRRLVIGGAPVSPANLQVRSVVSADEERLVFTANPIDDATVQHVWQWHREHGVTHLTSGEGVYAAAAGGPTTVIRESTLDEPGARWTLPSGGVLASHAEVPLVRPTIAITTS
jgi:dipeptidyl-peptidase 4